MTLSISEASMGVKELNEKGQSVTNSVKLL